MKRLISIGLAGILTCGLAGSAVADGNFHHGGFGHGGKTDFGRQVEELMNAQSEKLFGVKQPLAEDAAAETLPRAGGQPASERIKLAKGLKASYVARNMAVLADQITFWPNDSHYTHLIVCIEQGRSGTTPGGNGGYNASLQRVNVSTGQVETILHGMSRCDGIRTTAWGTVLVTEETGDGRAYEVMDPLTTTDNWVADRATGDIRDAVDSPNLSSNIVQRQALPTIAWEGLDVTPEGVVYGGDELRPGSPLDADGGAMFKFVPTIPASGPIGNLSQSPLASGKVYAFQASCVDKHSGSFPQYGQGCEIGEGAWVEVNALNASANAGANGATGYYRPEDGHFNPEYAGPGVQFCWTNTGEESAANFGEVMCLSDENPLGEGQVFDGRTGLSYLADFGEGNTRDMAVATANRVFEGNPRFNSVDNLAFQPKRGNMFVVEDHPVGEVISCLQDGDDRDIKVDGCVSTLSVRDASAEPTGFIFDGSGRTAFINIQHGEQPPELLDFFSNPVNGQTDDLIMIRGWK